MDVPNQQVGVLVEVKRSLIGRVSAPVRHVRMVFWLVPAATLIMAVETVQVMQQSLFRTRARVIVIVRVIVRVRVSE